MFQTKEEKIIFDNYIKKGYLIFNIKDKQKLNLLRKKVVNL